MAEFTAITSQDQLDSVIKDRLQRSEDKWTKKYEGYISPEDFKTQTAELQKQVTDLNSALEAANKKSASYDKDIADRDAKIKGYETSALRTRIAHEMGLGYDAVSFLKGDTEDDIKASAESLKSLIGTQKAQVPQFTNEPKVEKDSRKAALKDMLDKLNNN